MRQKSIVTIILFLLFITACTAQKLEKIDSLIDHLVARYSLQNVFIAGVENNKVIYQKSFGTTANKKALTDSSRIYIASNTKAFIGLAIAKLVFENKIKYTDSISKYIPSTYFPANIKIEKIKVKDLLQHTHGLSNDPLIFRTAYSGEYPSDLKELLQFTSYRNDTASRDFKYSNLGYLMAGMIIEKITGLDWKNYLESQLLKELGMNNTTAHLNFKSELEIFPFEHFSDNPLSSAKTANTLHAAGGLFSTLPDMAKWLSIFSNPNQTFVNPAILNLYLNEQIAVGQRFGPFSMDKYGNGWISGTLMGNNLFFHFGSFTGYESIMSFQPGSKRAVFVFVNERIGGQRIAAMLSAYFYLIASLDDKADEKISTFNQMIEPLYTKPKTKRNVFQYQNPGELNGVYYSPKYGRLLVDKTTDGFTFTIGKLSSLAYTDEKTNEILIEWTPGIKERFTIETQKNKLILVYDEFDKFTKQ